MVKHVEIDHFKLYRHPYRLRARGGRLAFLLKQANMDENKYHSDLWHLEADTPRQLTFSKDIAHYWWQEDDTLVFSRPGSEEDKQLIRQGLPLTTLYRLPLSSPGEAQPFLRLLYDIEDLLFLPDGRLLFLALYDPAKQAALNETPDETAAAARIERQKNVEVLTEVPFWANGEGFQSGRRHRLYLYDNGTVTPLTDEATDVEQLRSSPDGSAAFFVARRFTAVAPLDDRLYRLPFATLQPEDITFAAPFTHNAYAVADDETVLVFGSNRKAYGLNQNGTFYQLDLASRTVATLYEGGAYSGWESVATDLKHSETSPLAVCEDSILLISGVNESSQLLSIDPTTGEILPLTAAPGAVLEFAADANRIYLAALRGQQGSELYELMPDGTERLLTSFNTAPATQYAFSTPEPFAFPNKEGDFIRGFVLPPVNCSPQQNHPCVLYIHGGPKGIYGPVLFHEMQLLASRGFGVLFCNPTGSDGRGDAFADLRGRYGLVDTDDLMGFLDAALEHFSWIDPARLGVAGGSYGGYMVNWLIGHTARFAAAVSERGIASWLSLATLSDIGHTFVPDQTGATPWEDLPALWEQSPLKYANRVSTPTLFIHSEEDYRCPLPEGLQMYAALRTFGTDTRLCLFRDENHELSRSGKPQNRVRRLEEILAWFEAHLLPPEG